MGAVCGVGGSIDIFATRGTFSIFLQKGWKLSMICSRVEIPGILQRRGEFLIFFEKGEIVDIVFKGLSCRYFDTR